MTDHIYVNTTGTSTRLSLPNGGGFELASGHAVRGEWFLRASVAGVLTPIEHCSIRARPTPAMIHDPLGGGGTKSEPEPTPPEAPESPPEDAPPEAAEVVAEPAEEPPGEPEGPPAENAGASEDAAMTADVDPASEPPAEPGETPPPPAPEPDADDPAQADPDTPGSEPLEGREEVIDDNEDEVPA